MTEPAKHIPSAGDSQKMVLPPDAHLLLGTTAGEMNGARAADWIQAMKEMQDRRTEMQTWLKKMADLFRVCNLWLEVMRPWVKEIDMVVNSEPMSISLYVVHHNDKEITVSMRRAVAQLGLMLGSALDVRAEARLASTRPANCDTIIEHAGSE